MVTSDGYRWLWWWGLFLAATLGLRTVDHPDLWWHLSRGRTVVSGSLWPSSRLLSLNRAADADWLGGVPFYGLWSQAGVQGLAAIPLAAALVVWWRLSRDRSDRASSLWTPILAGLLLLVMRDGLQPVPTLFDLAGLWGVWQFAAAPSPLLRAVWPVALVFCLWANCATGLVWGLLLIALFPPRWNWRLLAAAIIGGSLTPRGMWTWYDAAVLFAPRVFAGPGQEIDPRWGGLLSGQASAVTTAALFAMWLVWLLARRRELCDPLVSARVSVPLLAALLSAEHVPLCGLWIALDAATFPVTVPSPSQRWLPVAIVAMSVVAVFDAWGGDPLRSRRIGWGLAQEIDPRLLDLNVGPLDAAHAGAWAADSRSAGIVSWIDAGVRLVDHPQRALIGGRWAEHAALIRDLRGAHRAAYRRDDGAWGGIVPRLQAWNTSWLFLPVEDVSLNRALLDTPWRPVDLDSPTVPYASTDDTAFARPILEVEQQEAFIEAGAWQPSPEVYAGHGWRFDLVELCGGGPDPGPAIRQSQLFRGRDVPAAALRALLPIRQHTSAAAMNREFRHCHEQLAYQEWVTFGDAGAFRKLVAHQLGARDHAAPWLQFEAASHDQEAIAVLRDGCVPCYLRGDIRGALAALPLQSEEEREAAALLWLELGETDRARVEFTALRASSIGSTKAAAEFWLRSLGSFQGGAAR